MNKEELIKFVKGFPDRPGVYLMRDENGEIIYVGKAKSLRKRVSSYFRHTHASPRLNKLVETIRDISTMRTETEIEALILENRLIKLYQPFFNVDLKMNERYAYIKITAEKHPRIIVTRVKMDDGAVYIGPYVRVSEVRALLRLVERYLPLRSCGGAEAKPQNGRPCMKYSLGRCLAPCCGLCTENEYRDRVADVALLLQGHGAELVERLRKRMDKAARELKFEEAAHLRDTIRAIWRVSRQQNTIPEIPSGKDNFWEVLNSMQKTFHLPVLPWRIDGFDISHSAGNFTVGVAVVFEQGYPNPSLYRKFNIRTVEGIDDFRSMKETLTRRYKRCLEGQEPLPQLILIDGGPVQLEFAMQALDDLGIHNIPIISLAKEFEEVYMPNQKEPVRLDHTDPVLRLLQHVRDESHRFAITSHRTRRGKSFTRSKIEEVPGIGRAKAAMLITKFGSVRAIKDLPPEELAAAPGIGPALAKRILAKLNEENETEKMTKEARVDGAAAKQD
ncbi:excinuclease ABC subunit UvrC [uncultured Cloacibacillus sp.]|uniref:excinuclease ABC subunit UvrC n=1 Tax=uncultured Cloacibacillus sp. TaxID=889794 RepID=UPI0026DD2A18|nr:excinuclease ABC subunit UvrC [uncultured Cloacibacillus sp.]